MIRLLNQISNWKFIVPAFVVVAIFSAAIFPQYQAEMSEHSGRAMAPLDTRFSYSADEVSEDFQALGPAGRDTYKTVVGKVDMLFPIAYGCFFILMLAYLLKKTFHDSRWILLSLLPLAGLTFDYLENISILSLLNNYPQIAPHAVRRAETMTQLKHGLLFLCVGLMLLLVAWLLIRIVVGKPDRSPAV